MYLTFYKVSIKKPDNYIFLDWFTKELKYRGIKNRNSGQARSTPIE